MFYIFLPGRKCLCLLRVGKGFNGNQCSTFFLPSRKCMFYQGFEGFSLNRVLCVMWHRSTEGQTRRALRGCWFSIGFTRYSLQIGLRPTGGCSSRAISAVTPLYVICLFPQWFLVNSGKPCSDPVVLFFLPSRKCLFFHCFEGFRGMFFF